MQFIRIDKTSNFGVVISTLQIIQFGFCIVIITTVSKRIDGSNSYTAIIGHNGTLAPRIIGISRNDFTLIIGNCNNIALKVLIEIICSAIVLDTTNRTIEVIQILIYILRATCRIAYNFLDNVRTVENILMDFCTCLLSDTNTVVVVLVRVATKCLELSTLFPRRGSSKVIGRVAVCIIISYLLLFVNKKSPVHTSTKAALGKKSFD